jgi:hypothetical protein
MMGVSLFHAVAAVGKKLFEIIPAVVGIQVSWQW